ncbi:MAG: hypothetical protein WBD31_23015 [Rubripirellula sp.]
MERSLSNRRTLLAGVIPYRRCFVSSRLLPCLVFLAALVQVVPAGLLSFRASVVDRDHAGCVVESLTTNTHVVESWITTPSSVVALVDPKSSDPELLPTCWGICDRRWTTRVNPILAAGHSLADGDDRFLATLVDLNVRLQI